MLKARVGRSSGFTLIELMVTVTLMAIMLALAFPAMSEWIRNNRIRTVSDSLQNGLRLAQSEALRRSRQVVFSLTDNASPESSLTAVANGRNWSINAVKLLTDESAAAVFIEKGTLSAVGADVQITGPAAVCFNSVGRLVTNSNPGVTGASCTTGTAQTYDITMAGSDRPLRVTVALGGQVRMCDPKRTLSSSTPDGCP